MQDKGLQHNLVDQKFGMWYFIEMSSDADITGARFA